MFGLRLGIKKRVNIALFLVADSFFMSMEYLVLLSGYGLLSLITFCFYGVDKSAARRGRQRVRESTLHVLSLMGGWPGAILGQKIFHHKTKKLRFIVIFWLMMIVNIVVLGIFAHGGFFSCSYFV
jgi:uncharacterized membrane protein YsdA (DUF1294 family)